MESSVVDTSSNVPSLDQLQQWANTPDLARDNLRSILSAVEQREPLIDWANEALENCGSPEVSELEFLNRQLASSCEDVVYWSCKLIARMGALANGCQESLCRVLANDKHPDAVKQQALLALGKVGELKPSCVAAIRVCSEVAKPQLATLAKQILDEAR
jgi:hypothetical protein